MPNYVLSGTDVISRRISRYRYPEPYNWHIVDSFPDPGREYTIILTTNWPTHPLATTLYIAELLLQARLVESDSLWSLREIYEGKNVLFCEHIVHAAEVSIMRAEQGYLFLCSHCVAQYAINGMPDLPDTLFNNFSHQLISTFPEPFAGES